MSNVVTIIRTASPDRGSRYAYEAVGPFGARYTGRTLKSIEQVIRANEGPCMFEVVTA